MTELHQIHNEVQRRVENIIASSQDWPCHKGCDECCRRLASIPRVTREEWRLIAAALDTLPSHTAEPARNRIRHSESQSRPIVCPLLDTNSGACLIYHARPVACRAYGFYAERENVLGCTRIERKAQESPDIVWGNHETLEDRLLSLGPAAELFVWLTSEDNPASAAK